VVIRGPQSHEDQHLTSADARFAADEGIAGSEPNTVSLRREIAVLDENDNGPVYHGRPYAARVPESARVGGLLLPPGTITVTDRDGGVNADVVASCVPASRDDDACRVFAVSSVKVRLSGLPGIINTFYPTLSTLQSQSSSMTRHTTAENHTLYDHLDRLHILVFLKTPPPPAHPSRHQPY
jgi:hypothetical protein